MGESVLHHIEERAFATEALLREQFVKIAGLIQRNFFFGPCIGLANVADRIDEESTDVVYHGGRVKFRIFTDVLIHVADVEAFACAHELAEECVTALGDRRIVARPRCAGFAEIQRVVLFGAGEVHGIAADKEQVLYRNDSVRDEIHERDAVDE